MFLVAGVIIGALDCHAATQAPSPNPCARYGGMDPQHCLLPWPSTAFLVADVSTRTGYRLQLPAELLPVNSANQAIDPGPWNRWDGYAPMTSLIADFPEVLDPSPLPTWNNPGASLLATSPTVIVDVDTGERIAHFSEVESSPDVAAGTTELYIRPAARLAEGHHYAVGIRGLKVQGGGDVAAGAPFAELRDGKPSLLDSRRAAFERDVFAPLTAAGVRRSSLLLAWDFRTGSGQTAWGDLMAMRDAAVAAAGTGGLGCSVTTVTEYPTDPVMYRQITGQFTVPNFLQAAPDGSLQLARDPTGLPRVVGTAQAPFTAIVPWTALAAAGTPAPLWIYGHGLFSDNTEVARNFGVVTASLGAAVAVGTDYTGLTLTDQGAVASDVYNLAQFPSTLDQLRQGIVNTLVLARTVAGACGGLPAFMSGGHSIVSTTNFGYFGNSMGGTLGITIAALSPDIPRVAVGVGGVDFPVMMPRTAEWATLEQFFVLGYPSRLDRDLLLVMSDEEWEVAESSAFAPHVLASPLPGSTVKNILLQIGLYDADTTNVASEMAGRTLGVPELTPTAHAVWGLTPQSAPQQNAYVVYDLGGARVPDGTWPLPVENGVHEGVRRDTRAEAQIAAFLRPGGQVVDTCGGACGPCPSCCIDAGFPPDSGAGSAANDGG